MRYCPDGTFYGHIVPQMTPHAAEASTLAAFTRVVGRVIADRGVDPASVMQRAGIDPAGIAEPGVRVPRTAMTRLWDEAVAATGDPAIGLATAAYFNPAASRTLGLGWLASSDLRQALTRVRRYHAILTSGLQMEIDESPNGVELRLIPHGDETDLAPAAVDAFFAITVRMCRMVSHEHFAPAALFMSRPDSGCHDAYREALGILPVFGADRDAIVVDAGEAYASLSGADPELAAELDRLSERYLADLDTDRMSVSVREVLEDLLPTGNPTLANVARVMKRSAKSIQRRLAAEGLSYRELQEQTRRALALRYVRDPSVPLSHVAQMLGFSDQSNFNRAFRRWSGSSPGSFRKKSRA